MSNVHVGSIVHYVSQGSPVRPDGTQMYRSLCRAATVTEVDPVEPGQEALVVGLYVANPTGLFFRSLADGGNVHEGVLPSSAPVPGSWHRLGECPSIPEEDRG
jgi:hypothetical protein